MVRAKLRMASVGREKRKDAGYQSLTKPGGHMSARSENTLFPSRPVQFRSLPHLRCLPYGVATETKVNMFVQTFFVCHQCPGARWTMLFCLILTCRRYAKGVCCIRLESVRLGS